MGVGEVLNDLVSPSSPPSDAWRSANAFNSDYDGFPWLWCFIVFVTLVTSFEQYLNLRQYQKYRLTTMPDNVRQLNIITDDEFIKAQHYSSDKMIYSMVMKTIDFGIAIVFYLFFIYPKAWTVAGLAVGANEYLQSLTFLFLLLIFETIKSILPDLYFDFVIEEKHGFNKKTIGLFFADEAKQFVLTCVIGGPLICAVIWIVRMGGPNFYLWLWGFSILVALLMMIIYPNLIAPLFNKFKPLQDEELRGKIEQLAGELHFPLTKLYEVDASIRSSHSNAYFYGFWKWKRIVLFDTLLDTSHDQILAILGHELGHWKLNHMPKAMVLSFTHMFVMLYLYSVVMTSTSLYHSFGFVDDSRACIVGLILFSWIFSPVESVVSLFMNWMTRVHEFQADGFAVGLGFAQPLSDGLVHIHKKSKVPMCTDKWYAFYHYTHPPLLERLEGIQDRIRDIKMGGSVKGVPVPAEKHPLLDGATKVGASGDDDDGGGQTDENNLLYRGKKNTQSVEAREARGETSTSRDETSSSFDKKVQ